MPHRRLTAVILGSLASLIVSSSFAAELKVLLPLGRTAYQNNEWIDVSVVRSSPQPLAKGDLVLTLTGEDGSKVTAKFLVDAGEPSSGVTGPVAAAPPAMAIATERLHVNGRLLRPGHYTIEVAGDGATATGIDGLTDPKNLAVKKPDGIDIYSSVRKSSFKVGDWGGAAGKPVEAMGEDSLGFNTMYGEYRAANMPANGEFAVRGGIDFMQLCTMSGAHQMDLRMECDWSDPYVLGGGVARGVQEAFISRTFGNAIGVHLYDEPGLTWWKDPKTGAMVPFNIPAQDRQYESSFGKKAPQYSEVKGGSPELVSDWRSMNRWKESFMEAAWKMSAFNISYADPKLMTVTQSMYGWHAYADGYYFNITRPLPVISGHGGYDDGVGTYMFPSFTFEFGRMRELAKPSWYLPSWYGIPSDNYRMEQFLSFQANVQGNFKPPTFNMTDPAKCPNAAGIVEANKTQARLGTIFDNLPIQRSPVAILYSLSQQLDGEIHSIEANTSNNYIDAAYEGGGHRLKCNLAYLASKMIHTPLFPIVDEDVLDGTLARHHKAVLLAGVNYLPEKEIATLEAFAAAGGAVIVSDDSKIEIKGAQKLGAPFSTEHSDLVQKLWTDKKQGESQIETSFGRYAKVLEPVAKAMAERFKANKIDPVIDTDAWGISATKQGNAAIEYIFTVNATPDIEANQPQAITSADASIGIPDDGRAVYDAVYGGEASQFAKEGGMLRAKLRYGPGQMRVFARTAKPIAAIQVLPPSLQMDFTVEQNPMSLNIEAILLGNDNRVLAGSAPLAVQVIDPLGVVRYDLYRSTTKGMLKLNLPLAANDPAGEWKVVVRELLSNKGDTAAFTLDQPAQCGAIAGETHRALLFGADRDNLYRFFQLHKDITIVTGKGDQYQKVADRLAEALKPWDVRCKMMAAEEAAKPRQIPEAIQQTWVGLAPGKPDFKNPNPSQVGFAVQGPVILIGTPQDNALIKFVADNKFLPYPATAEVIGRNHGYLAWQSDAVGYFNQESISLIAYDEKGLDEAVGNLYEICAGLDPLTKFEPAALVGVDVAKQPADAAASLKQVWRTVLTDRVLGMKADGANVSVITVDGSTATLGGDGKIANQNVGAPGAAVDAAKAMAPAADANADATAKKVKAPRFISKFAIPHNDLTAVAYWGGRINVVDNDGKVKFTSQLPQDISAILSVNGNLIVGLADGEVVALTNK